MAIATRAPRSDDEFEIWLERVTERGLGFRYLLLSLST